MDVQMDPIRTRIFDPRDALEVIDWIGRIATFVTILKLLYRLAKSKSLSEVKYETAKILTMGSAIYLSAVSYLISQGRYIRGYKVEYHGKTYEICMHPKWMSSHDS
jgi:hypothetical protein